MALIEEAISEVEQDIVEGTELLAGIETETDDTRDENLIHPETQVQTEEHTYSLHRGGDRRMDYMHQRGFQVKVIKYALTQLSMKCGLNKFKKKGEKAVTAELEQLHKRDTSRPVSTEDIP